MEEIKTLNQCLNCDSPETKIPLISLHYAGSQNWICPQCFPTLIHHPQRLAGKLAGTDRLAPTPPPEN